MEFGLKAKEKLVTTGVRSLDAQLGGGTLPGTTLLLLGDPGIGSEVFAHQFISGGLENGERAFYFSTDHPINELRDNMHRLGIDAEKYEKKKKLLFIDAYTPRFISILPPELSKEISDKELLQKGVDSLNQLKMAIEADYGRKYRGVIDSLSFFLRSYDVKDVSDAIEIMSSIGKMAGGSHLLLMTRGMHDVATENAMKHIADGVIEIFFKERGSELERLLVVRKMRGMLTPNKMMSFTIGPKGIDLEVMTRVL
ncbi:MAG: ATPase domain-containing protein [Methanocellales archaeon]|nr:ATPase domain-containing protein [Methanocellales archaeon]